jgi:hypothetical protein
VVSALAIGGTYVAWRNAAGEKQRKLERAESLQKAADEEEEEMALMVGSKSPGGSLITREMAQEKIDSNPRTASDFITPLAPSDDSILPELEEIEEAPGQVLLPSSKIGILVIPKIIEEKEGADEETKKLLPGSKSSLFFWEDPEPKKPE